MSIRKKNSRILHTLTFLSLCFCLLSHQQATAQVKNEEVTVIAPYEPSLSDAFKININPEIDEKELEKPDLKYNVSPRLLPTNYEPLKITPAKLSGDPLTKLYQSYAKAGFGNYTTPYAELFYNNLRSRTTNLGIHYKHYSSSGKIKDFAPAAFSDNILDAYGAYYAGSHILNAGFLYQRNAFHYYGFKPSEYNLPVNDSLKKATLQKYQTLELTASVKSDYNEKDKWHHGADFNFYNLKNSQIVENALSFNAFVKRDINITRKIEDEKIILDAQAKYYNNPVFSKMKDAGIYSIKPQLSFLMNQYALNIGLNASVKQGDLDEIFFFPVIEGKIAIAQDVLSLYGSFTGNVERNNIRTLFEENPFIIANFDSLQFTKNKVVFSGGIKGNIASALSFNIGGRFIESENAPFFINDTAAPFGQFNLIYDDVTTTGVYADFSFQTSEKFMFLLRGAFNHYTMGVDSLPWHKPQLTGSLLVTYCLVDKINIKSEIFAQDNSYAKVFNTTTQTYEAKTLNGFADINIGLEYLYNKKISAFLNFNNIAGQRYYQWYNYPNQRFHVLGGLTYAF